MTRSLILAAMVVLASGPVSEAQGAAQQLPVPDGPQTLTLEGVAAIVNDQPISYSDVRQRASLLLLGLAAQPTPEQVQQVTGQALEQLIDEKLQLQEAAQYDVQIEAEAVQSAIADMARQAGLDRETFLQQLVLAGINPASIEDQMRAEIAWQRIMGGLYGSRIRISDNQIREQIERLRLASSKVRYDISEIFLFASDPATRTEAMEAGQSIVAQLRQGAPFELAAQRFSSAPTAANGGRMGWMTADDLDPDFLTVLEGMTAPAISEPFEVSNGVYILQLRNRAEPRETVSLLALARLTAIDGSEATLQDAIARIGGCDDLQGVADASDRLEASTLGRVALSDLGADGRQLVEATPSGQPTAVFEAASGPSVMYVCERADNVENLPSRAEVENRLFADQLGMISQRSLRNLRREATIIRR